MTHASLSERLSTSQTLAGLLQMQFNPLLVDLAAQCGYDFLFLDGEHGTFSEEDFRLTLRSLGATDVLAWVRLGGHDFEALARYVDMGADGIVVPHVSTMEEARAMAAAMDRQSRKASLIAIIESKPGVLHAEQILGLDGIDGAIVGPNDLATDLGCQGDYGHAVYAEALSHIELAAAKAGKPIGTIPHGSYSLTTLLTRGHRIIILGTDRSLLHRAMKDQLVGARSNARSFET